MESQRDAKARMMARHEMVMGLIDNNARRLRCDNQRHGVEIERKLAVRAAALPGAPPSSQAAIAECDERLFDLFCEHSLGANLRQRDVGDLVARRLDDFDFDLVSARAQQRRDVVGLPKRQLRSARTNAQVGHQFVSPEALDLARLYSQKAEIADCSIFWNRRTSAHADGRANLM